MPVDYERWNLDGAGGIYAYRASRWVRIGSYEIEFYHDQFGMQMRITPSLELPPHMTITLTYGAVSPGIVPPAQSWHPPVPLWESTGRVREVRRPVRQPAHRDAHPERPVRQAAHRDYRTKQIEADRVAWELAQDVLPSEIYAALERDEEVRLPSTLYAWCEREYRFTYRSVRVGLYEAARWAADLCVQPDGGYLPKPDWCVFQYLQITANEEEWLMRAAVVKCVSSSWRKMLRIPTRVIP
jgi:hypothetical protein